MTKEIIAQLPQKKTRQDFYTIRYKLNPRP